MSVFSPQILFIFEALLFVLIVLMHLTKKNSSVVFLYVLQSLIVAAALFISSFEDRYWFAVGVAVIMLAVKVIAAPYFFLKLIKQHQLLFSASTYFNNPLTLIVLAILTIFSYSRFFTPLSNLAPGNEKALLLSVAAILISVWLIINRKGALSQMVGVLSLENSIVSFAYLAGLESAAGIQISMLFDIFVWIIIGLVFTSMIYKHFGSLDVSVMQNLKD